MAQIRTQAEHGLAIAPLARVQGVAGGDEEIAAVAAEAGGRPDAAAAPARAPAADAMGIGERDADDHAVILAAIAEMPAERHVKCVVEDHEGAALTLIARVEAAALAFERVAHI